MTHTTAEKRAYPRLRLRITVRYQEEGIESIQDGVIDNISLDGFLLRSKQAFAANTKLRFLISSDKSETEILCIPVTVVWTNPEKKDDLYDHGCSIEGMINIRSWFDMVYQFRSDKLQTIRNSSFLDNVYLMNCHIESSMIPDIMLADAGASDGTEVLHEVLGTIRSHLDMDIAFVSEFLDGRRVFRYIDSKNDDPPIQVGDSDPLDESYCQRICDGRLPQLIRDASLIPEALELPVTTALPIGAHLSVPIYLSDGSVYGTFCCFSRTADPTLAERDLAIMRVFADFASKQIERQFSENRTKKEITNRIKSVIDNENFSIVYQPIYHVLEDRIIGFESLTRFHAVPVRAPDVWFNEAADVGLDEDLEIKVIEKALQGLDQLPEEIYISLNISPKHIISGAIASALIGAPLRRIVLEVTEHAPVLDYFQFSLALDPLRKQGLRLAVDDAGAGYASFRHILNLNPEIIKLDNSLVRDIHVDPTRRALAAAIIAFAEEIGSKVVAEGVETDAEFSELRCLKVNKMQGYLIGRPVLIADALGLLQS